MHGKQLNCLVEIIPHLGVAHGTLIFILSPVGEEFDRDLPEQNCFIWFLNQSIKQSFGENLFARHGMIGRIDEKLVSIAFIEFIAR